jgi:hypothetical protein
LFATDAGSERPSNLRPPTRSWSRYPPGHGGGEAAPAQVGKLETENIHADVDVVAHTIRVLCNTRPEMVRDEPGMIGLPREHSVGAPR